MTRFCVHNSCRSQIAEAPGKHLRGDEFDFYSAGTKTKPQIDKDALRLINKLYGIDMEMTQYSKTIDKIPTPDVAISMGRDRHWQANALELAASTTPNLRGSGKETYIPEIDTKNFERKICVRVFSDVRAGEIPQIDCY